jgi:hypothetical protein
VIDQFFVNLIFPLVCMEPLYIASVQLLLEQVNSEFATAAAATIIRYES